MNFEDYCEECAWRNNISRAVHVAEVGEDGKIVSGTRPLKPISNGETYFCGALGIKCHEKICAPFYFIKKMDELNRKRQEEFLYELTMGD